VCGSQADPRAEHLIVIQLNCVLLSAPQGLDSQVTALVCVCVCA